MNKRDQQAHQIEGEEDEEAEKNGFHKNGIWGKRNNFSQDVFGRKESHVWDRAASKA